jgi:hypothetical protein
MDIFSPSKYPGVGIGDVTSIAGIGGLVGLAVAVALVLVALGFRAVRNRIVRSIAAIALGAALAATGMWWADYRDSSLHFGSHTSIGVAVALVAGAIGGVTAARFIRGSVQAGGDSTIVQAAVLLAALIDAAVSVFVPFVGFAFALLCAFFTLRQRRRAGEKHAGLRILNG